MVHRTLAATPPAALTVALADEDGKATVAATTGDAAVGGGGGGAIPVDRRLGLDEDPPVEAEAVVAGNGRGMGKGKGRKRGRSEMAGAGGCSSGEEEERDGVDEERGQSGRCHPRGGASRSRRRGGRASSSSSSVPPPPSLFVAGRPVTAAIDADTGEDVVVPPGCDLRRRRRQRGASGTGPATTPVPTSAVEKGSTRGRADHRRDWLERVEAGGALREDGRWAGARDDGEARDLGRRVKHALVGLFHRGAASGCPALVEICLQVCHARRLMRGLGDVGTDRSENSDLASVPGFVLGESSAIAALVATRVVSGTRVLPNQRACLLSPLPRDT